MGRALRPALVAAVLATACDSGGSAARAGDIVVTHAYLPAPATSRAAAVYLTLTNTGDSPDTLLGLAAPVAERGALHETVQQAGQVLMRPVTGVAIAPGATVLLEPGRLHGMLVGLKGMPQDSEEVDVTLTFARADTVTIPVPVVPYAEVERRATRARDATRRGVAR